MSTGASDAGSATDARAADTEVPDVGDPASGQPDATVDSSLDAPTKAPEASSEADVTDAAPRADAGDAELWDGGCGSSTVTFQLDTPPGSFWWLTSTEDTDTPPYGPWLTLFGADGGQLYTSFTGDMLIDCRTCAETTTPIPVGLTFMPVDGGSVVSASWNGYALLAETCGPGGVACLNPFCASPGAYVAEMCACAGGAFVAGGCQSYTCVKVPFDYSGDTTVVGTLPVGDQ
ncbi:MAG: hypothetical protein ABSE49_08520 [Polyangiaceae bacterium]